MEERQFELKATAKETGLEQSSSHGAGQAGSRSSTTSGPVPAAPVTPARNRLLILLSLLALYLLWGGTYLGMRIALEGFPPFFVAAFRQFTAGVILFFFLRMRGVPSPTRVQWIGPLVVGALLLLFGNGLVVFAEQYVSSGLAALALGAIPLWASLFSGLFGRWPRSIEWCGLAIGFAGLVLLNLENGFHANILGAVLLIVAPVSWALGSILSQHLPAPKGLMASAAQMLAGGALLFLVGLGTGERMTAFPGPRPLLAMIYLVAGGSLVAFSAYGYLLRTVRPALATSYAYVNPLIAVALGALLAGEQVSLMEIVAMLTILSGVALVSLGRERS
jgi:drug/metabolite transporter (DMT)-like permease